MARKPEAAKPLRVAVLASGTGTTLQAVIDACESGDLDARVVVVISNNSDSGALERARRHRIPARHLSGHTHSDPAALDGAIAAALGEHHPDLVLLAGYMKKLGAHTLEAYRGRIVNTHPNQLAQQEAVETLGDIEEPGALDALTRIAQEHPDEQIVSEAIETIRDLSKETLHPQILALAASGRTPRIRRDAVEAIADAVSETGNAQLLDRAEQVFERAIFDDPDGSVRREALDAYEHSKALDAIERFFWGFTDDYLELVKQRAYGAHGPAAAATAVGALRTALDVLLRLFAPFLPYVTEEVWSWWRDGSVHRSSWPTAAEASTDDADPAIYEVAAAVLTAVRKEKALAKVSLKTPVDTVTVHDTQDRLRLLSLSSIDLREAGNIRAIEQAEADAFSVETVLAKSEPSAGTASA